MHKQTATISISLTGYQSNYNFHLAGFFMLGASALLKFEIRLEKSWKAYLYTLPSPLILRTYTHEI